MPKLEQLLVLPQPNEQEQQPQPNKKKAKEAKGGVKVKDIVFKMIPCLFPQVIEHILTSNEINPDAKVEGEEGKQLALKAAEVSFNFLKNFVGKKQRGYMYSKGEDLFEFSPYSNCKLSKWPLT